MPGFVSSFPADSRGDITVNWKLGLAPNNVCRIVSLLLSTKTAFIKYISGHSSSGGLCKSWEFEFNKSAISLQLILSGQSSKILSVTLSGFWKNWCIPQHTTVNRDISLFRSQRTMQKMQWCSWCCHYCPTKKILRPDFQQIVVSWKTTIFTMRSTLLKYISKKVRRTTTVFKNLWGPFLLSFLVGLRPGKEYEY